MMEQSSFWNDLEKSSFIAKESKVLKDKLSEFNFIEEKYNYLLEISEILKDDEDIDYIKMFEEGFLELKSGIENMSIKTHLNGEYDKNNAILMLHAGAGGVDAQDWTEILLRMYTRFGEASGYKVTIIEIISGDEAGIKGATLKFEGQFAYGYLKSEKGIHRLVRISPFNSNGKRQTSFSSVEILPEIEDTTVIKINDEDLKIDTYRAGGAGGQHVNKTESAIRITHLKTGIVVQCQSQRSQLSNKETAMKMLISKLVELKDRTYKEKLEDLTGDLIEIGFGSQIRSYVFHPYSLVKDHRTNVETSDVAKVLDGDLEVFVKEYINNYNK